MHLRRDMLVLVEHGSSKTGQVALVVALHGNLVELRKFRASGQGDDGQPGKFGGPVTLPRRAIIGQPNKTDPRVIRAKQVLLAGHAAAPEAASAAGAK